MQTLALYGGTPQRDRLLHYGRHSIDDSDIRAVVAVLRSDWLTTGPHVEAFEQALSESTATREAVVLSSGTAALHAAMFGLGIGPGDEVIVPAMTFAATANVVVYQGGTPVFADVDPETLLVDPTSVEARITERTRAVIAVDYAGQPCDYEALRAVTADAQISLVADGCHSLGGADRGRPVGSLADMTAFSFHPVKPITTGEGGAVTTDDPALAKRMRTFRNHGITTDHRERLKAGVHGYDMVELGYNYRLTDLQCALGWSQLRRLPDFVASRQRIAREYNDAFSNLPGVRPLAIRRGVSHSYHIYPIRLELDRLSGDRDTLVSALRAEGIGVNVHYIPVYFHTYYRERFGTGAGLCRVAEAAYQALITLPLFSEMSTADTADVVQAVQKVISHYLV